MSDIEVAVNPLFITAQIPGKSYMVFMNTLVNISDDIYVKRIQAMMPSNIPKEPPLPANAEKVALMISKLKTEGIYMPLHLTALIARSPKKTVIVLFDGNYFVITDKYIEIDVVDKVERGKALAMSFGDAEVVYEAIDILRKYSFDINRQLPFTVVDYDGYAYLYTGGAKYKVTGNGVEFMQYISIDLEELTGRRKRK